MIGKFRLILGLMGLSTGLFSCTSELEKGQYDANSLTLNVELATLSADIVENELNDVSVYLFSEGSLKKVKDDVILADGESSSIEINYNDGDHLYFVSQNGKVMTSDFPETETEFCSMMGKAYNNTSAPVFVTGGIELKKNVPNPVTLVRGVSRIDVGIVGEGLSVKNVQLQNMAVQGLLFEQEGGSIPAVESRADLTADFTDQPVSGLQEGMFYVYEQISDSENPAKALITYIISGQEKTVETILPATLQRNKIYTLNLILSSQEVSLTVDVAPWGKGDETDLTPDLTQKILIDADKSVLPSGASISETGDILYLTSAGGTATLHFNSIADVECVSTSETDVEVTQPEGLERNTFVVKGKARESWESTGFIDLLMRQKGMITTVNRVTVVIPANDVQFFTDAALTNAVGFVDNGIDYGKYIDGTLGYLVVPEGADVNVSGIWIRLDKADDVIREGKDVYRVEGGFKPNDPEADGRVQEASVTIDDEVYKFKRLNWGLPVVEINGVYWCKYNLRGNVKKFEDQISIRCDRDTVQSLENYLRNFLIPHPLNTSYTIPRSVKDLELFYRMLGQGYQAGNTDGMIFKSDKILSFWGDSIMSDKYYYKGYDTYFWEEETGLLPAETMAPDGYKVPENSDFRKLVPSENFLLGTAENTTQYTVNGVNMSVELFYMPAMTFEMRQFSGITGEEFQGNFNMGGGYGTSLYYIFKQEGMSEPLVLMGHPYQSKKLDGGTQTVVNNREILFVCHDSSGKAWYINASDDTQPVYFKSVGGNQMNNTKMIRCVKKPVNYIIKD